MPGAKAVGVPIVVEGFERERFKELIGLSLKSDAAVVQVAPGGREQTVTLIHHPAQGPTVASALNAVNRALEKHDQALLSAALVPTRQAYAENIWQVWLHTGNVVCALPYNSLTDSQHPQDANLEVGVQISLVAQEQPLKEVVDLQYMGAGFNPLPPDVEAIGDTPYFKGAYTLGASYAGILTARAGSQLKEGTVAPAAATNQHTVTTSNGFNFNVGANCNLSGNCSATATFSFTSQKSTTKTIAERSIDAATNYGPVPDQNGQLCDDVKNGCWQATHNIQYLLSSTQTSSGGYPIDLPSNSWYNFFNLKGNPIVSTSAGDAVQALCDACSTTQYSAPPIAAVYNWPTWASQPALTAGEATYQFEPGFNGVLDLSATFSATEGIFSLGHGAEDARLANSVSTICYYFCSQYADYVLDLYTDAASTSANISIDANQVNYSQMPTCAMLQYTQQDLGIYQIVNETNNALTIGEMRYSPFNYSGVPLVSLNYRGSDQYLVGVSNTIVQPGGYQYVALCSSSQTASPAMMLVYTYSNGAQGSIGFTGAGQVDGYNPSQVSYNAAQQLFTVSQPSH